MGGGAADKASRAAICLALATASSAEMGASVMVLCVYCVNCVCVWSGGGWCRMVRVVGF